MWEAIGTALLIILAILKVWVGGSKKREEKQVDEQMQQGRKDIVDGDTDAVSARIDRLLTKARDRNQRGEDSETKWRWGCSVVWLVTDWWSTHHITWGSGEVSEMSAACPEEEYRGSERRTRCEHADEAAEKAVQKTFAILGVDVDNPRQVEEFRMGLRFGEQLRKAADKGIIAFVTLVIGALMATLWVGFKHKIGG
jgi:hypothetical protein